MTVAQAVQSVAPGRQPRIAPARPQAGAIPRPPGRARSFGQRTGVAKPTRFGKGAAMHTVAQGRASSR